MKLMMATFHLAAQSWYCCSGSLLHCHGLLGRVQNRDIVNVITNTCAFPTITSQKNVKKACYMSCALFL